MRMRGLLAVLARRRDGRRAGRADRARARPTISRPWRGTVTITLDLDAARCILAVLSAETFDLAEAKPLEMLPAVRVAIQDSNRPPEIFEHDLAAAFESRRGSRSSTFGRSAKTALDGKSCSR